MELLRIANTRQHATFLPSIGLFLTAVFQTCYEYATKDLLQIKACLRGQRGVGGAVERVFSMLHNKFEVVYPVHLYGGNGGTANSN